MPKYMLTRDLRRQPLVGHRLLDRNGVKITENITYVFEPQKIVDTEDVSMRHWVDDGVLVEIKDVTVKNIIEEIRWLTGSVDAGEGSSDGSSDGEAGTDGYESVDGMFRCLNCDKTLKSEGAMRRHVEAKH